MKNFTRGSLIASMLLSAAGVANAAVFTDTTKVNVLRQYNLALTNQVTSSVSIANASSIGQNTRTDDGSATPSGAGGWGTNSTWTETFTLPGARTVGSYKIDWLSAGNRPANFMIEGKRASDGVFVTLVNQSTNAGGHDAANFSSSETVTQLRYTASGLAPGATTMLTEELSVFMAAGQTVAVDAGYNFLADPGVVPNRKASTLVGGTQWKGFSGNPLVTSTNNGFDNGDAFRVQSDGNNNQRGYLAYQFASPTDLHMMSIGMFNGQTLPNWEIYTSNSAALFAGLDSLTTATPTALQAAGWTLQHAQVAPVGNAFAFKIDDPGAWQYLLYVKSEADDGNPVEFEMFTVPEPSAAVLIGLAGVGMLRRRRM